jgi:hypothetical protein
MDDDDTVILSSSMINSKKNDIMSRESKNNIEIDVPDIHIEPNEDGCFFDFIHCESPPEIKYLYDFCCICGKTVFEHNKERHKYFCAKDEYKCKKCGLFFYEHTHNSKGCIFTPFKHLSQ